MKVTDIVMREMALDFPHHFMTLQKIAKSFDLKSLEYLWGKIDKRHSCNEVTIAVYSNDFGHGGAGQYSIPNISVRRSNRGRRPHFDQR